MSTRLALFALLSRPAARKPTAWNNSNTTTPVSQSILVLACGRGRFRAMRTATATSTSSSRVPTKPSNGVWFFENTTGDTKKNKLPVFKPAKKLSGTVHYVMPSYVEGKLRVLSPGTEYPHFTAKGISEKLTLPLDKNFYKPVGKQTKGSKVRHNQWRYADYDGDGKLDVVVGIEDWSEYGWDDAYNAKGEWTNGPLHGFVFVFLAKEEEKYAEPFRVEADGKPIDVYGCPSPNFADFDGDGDLDLLCGEFLDGFTYFENTGTRTKPKYAPGRRVADTKNQPLKMDLQMIVPVAFDWDKDGDLDLIVGDEDGRVAFVENTGKLDANRTPVFVQLVYFQQVADALKCGALATPVCVDWDGDGDLDIVSGNTRRLHRILREPERPAVWRIRSGRHRIAWKSMASRFA